MRAATQRLSRFAGGQAFDILALLVVLLVLWQLTYEFAGEVAISSPVSTVSYSLGLIDSADFWSNAWATLRAFLIALIIAVVGGLWVGIVLGFSRLFADVMEPALVAFYSIPKLTLYPIILLFFGIGLWAEVAFGVIHGVVPIIMFTMNAVRTIKPVHFKTARVLRLSFPTLVRTIIIPATLPEIFTGLRVGLSLTLIGTLLSEMFGSRMGLGYMLMNAIGLNSVTLIMSLTFLLVSFAAIVNMALLAIENRLYRRA